MPERITLEREFDRFRSAIFTQVLVVCLILSLSFSMMGMAAILPLPRSQIILNVIYALFCASFLYGNTRLQARRIVLYRSFALISFITFSLTVLFIPWDPWRFVWFFPTVAAIFLLCGIRDGEIAAIASVAIAFGDHFIIQNLRLISFLSFSGGLFAITLISRAFALQVEQSIRVAVQDSLRDPLTKIPNRRAFEQVLAILQSRTDQFSLLLLDVDHFKRINDTYGHAAGDQVLVHLAGLFSELLRKNDRFARIGGEEFAILLPDTTEEEAYIVAERLRKAIAESTCVFGRELLRYTVSIGIATARPRRHAERDVRSLADAALYAAKRNGRNRSVRYAANTNTMNDHEEQQ